MRPPACSGLPFEEPYWMWKAWIRVNGADARHQKFRGMGVFLE